MEYYPVFKENEILPSGKTWANQEDITVSRYKNKITAQYHLYVESEDIKPREFWLLGDQQGWDRMLAKLYKGYQVITMLGECVHGTSGLTML